jgi:hypothetical protein
VGDEVVEVLPSQLTTLFLGGRYTKDPLYEAFTQRLTSLVNVSFAVRSFDFHTPPRSTFVFGCVSTRMRTCNAIVRYVRCVRCGVSLMLLPGSTNTERGNTFLCRCLLPGRSAAQSKVVPVPQG